MGIDLVAPNPCFMKYVHHSQNPPAQQSSGACISKDISSSSLCNCSKLVGREGCYVTSTSSTKCTSDLRGTQGIPFKVDKPGIQLQSCGHHQLLYNLAILGSVEDFCVCSRRHTCAYFCVYVPRNLQIALCILRILRLRNYSAQSFTRRACAET